MDWVVYAAIGVGVAVFLLVRLMWRGRTYAEVLAPYLADHGYEIVRIEVPRFYQTGPFPMIAFRAGAVQTRIGGIDTTRFAHRIVTFRDHEQRETTRWVRLLVNSFGVQDIIWEPGTTEVPDKKGWPGPA